MTKDTPDPSRVEDELEVTDLRPQRIRARGVARLPGLPTRAWQRLILGLGLVLLVAVLLAGPLSGSTMFAGFSATRALPTATQFLGPSPAVSTAPPPTPTSSLLQPTALPRSSPVPALGSAPARCSQESPALTQDGPPNVGEAIGSAPVLLGGFVGPYATLPLGTAASANSYDWSAPHSVYGWPAPIGLILSSGVTGPVTLSGWDVRTGHPLWFGFVVAGVWGAPQYIAPIFRLDPAHPVIQVGGWTSSEQFWYGYAFLPGAGCDTLVATWPGGSWRITVSAGVVSTGH